MQEAPKKLKVMPVISTDMKDLLVPGVMVEVDAATAEYYGAFVETALSEEDAWEANADLINTALFKEYEKKRKEEQDKGGDKNE